MLKYEDLTEHEKQKFELHRKFDSSLTDKEILEIIEKTREQINLLKK